MSDVELPPLPEPDRFWSEADDEHIDAWLAADVLRAWGRQCYEAALEAAAVKCDAVYTDEQKEAECYGFARDCAAAIRAMKPSRASDTRQSPISDSAV